MKKALLLSVVALSNLWAGPNEASLNSNLLRHNQIPITASITNNTLTLNATSQSDNLSITLWNTKGQYVIQKSNLSMKEGVELSLPIAHSMAQGIYFLDVKEGERRIGIQKIIY